MKKWVRIVLNVAIFLVVAAFVWYIAASVGKKGAESAATGGGKSTFESPYRLDLSFDTGGQIAAFELFEERFYVASDDSVKIFDMRGLRRGGFKTGGEARDMAIAGGALYLLRRSSVEVYDLAGAKLREWSACSNNSDYCAVAVTKEHLFACDAANKNITQYTLSGDFVGFIFSSDGFVIPSYSFGIVAVGDTVYCSNSGRHTIEAYTPDGRFVSSFGKSGSGAGEFAGCCNPVYLAATSAGNIVTSEKGDPRICCYGRDGTFLRMLLDAKTLGGGNAAYRVKVSEKILATAVKRKISIYYDKGD